jgi:hypothetical protein
LAVTVSLLFVMMVLGLVLPEMSPLQEEKYQPVAGVAEILTTVPSA